MSRTRTTPPKLELDVELSLDEGELVDVSLDGIDPDFLESGNIPPAPPVPSFELDVDLPSYDVDESSGVVSWHADGAAHLTPKVPARLAGDAVPRVSMARALISSLPLDHRAGFVLSLVDSASTVDEILDLAGMPPTEAREILIHLARRGVIDLG
ncbi:MAG: hypothetical protein IT374_25350 [Polyangiaceae bacterium]|nr:hypothetical protein [Polyangiaceae bacterium]